ncbi:MAG: SET domain-containing protein [Chthoniobacterales bacterium]
MATATSTRNGAAKKTSRIVVRNSTIHGRGVFATTRIRKGTRIIEYTGRRVPWKKAKDEPPRDPRNPYHTFLFSLDNGDVIDAAVDGNEARWINHSCDPNCETTEEDDRVFVHALRTLRPGEELFYDYKIVPAERRSKKLEKHYACFCGTKKCRGTLLEPLKRRKRRQSKAKT